MYQYLKYEWITHSKKGKMERIAQLRQLNASGRMSRRSAIRAIRLVMEYGITEKYAIELLDGKGIM